MNAGTLVRRSLIHDWRVHLGTLAACAIATAVLVGALAVGDSVRESLRKLALQRLQRVDHALHAGDRMIRQQLAEQLQGTLPAGSVVEPALHLEAAASKPGSKRRVPLVQLFGVTPGFARLGSTPANEALAEDEAAISAALASQLEAKPGDTIVLRVAKPSVLPRDAPLSIADDLAAVLRVKVRTVLEPSQMGEFALRPATTPALNAFIPLTALQQKLDVAGKVNLLLTAGTAQQTGAALNDLAGKHWTLADAQLEIRELPAQGVHELRSPRVFLDPLTVQAVTSSDPAAKPLLAYFVNELKLGSKATPYSMIVASASHEDLGSDRIVLTDWLAEDLQASVGSEVTITYFVLGQSRELQERSTTLKVARVVPTESAGADRELMPEFPGISKVDKVRDWKPGIPVDLRRIRDKDEAYWKEHRGSPKAIISLSLGRALWGNRFGDSTAIRWPADAQATKKLTGILQCATSPQYAGPRFMPVREQALAAAKASTDFGGLFLGLSAFLLISALTLCRMLFGFVIEQRTQQMGTMLALGLPRGLILRVLMMEGCVLALGGAALGTPAGLAYTAGIVRALGQGWSGAVGGTVIAFHVEPASLLTAVAASVLTAATTLALTARRVTRLQPAALLAGVSALEAESAKSLRSWSPALAGVALLGAGALLASAGSMQGQAQAGAFFGAGALLLTAALALVHTLMRSWASTSEAPLAGLAAMGVRSLSRRSGRSLAVIALLASGLFLVLAVGAFRQHPDSPSQRSSGTGGFAYYSQLALPLLHNLHTPAGQEEFNLEPADVEGVSIVPLRVRDGEDASCLNLNQATQPRILAVEPSLLQDRGSFSFAAVEASAKGAGWNALEQRLPDGSVPAAVDQSTAMWALHRSLGDTITYTDHAGREFKVRIVALLADSILQGQVVVSEKAFLEKYPDQSGSRVLLVDAPEGRREEVRRKLENALSDLGIELTPAAERLARFQQVQNTYLDVFLVLGALGMMLGSAGLGMVVLRQVMERRGELALMRAVGFTQQQVVWTLLAEHAMLAALGVGAGTFAAGAAVWPLLKTPHAATSLAGMGLAAGLLLAAALGFVLLACLGAVRGSMLEALKRE